MSIQLKPILPTGTLALNSQSSSVGTNPLESQSATPNIGLDRYYTSIGQIGWEGTGKMFSTEGLGRTIVVEGLGMLCFKGADGCGVYVEVARFCYYDEKGRY